MLKSTPFQVALSVGYNAFALAVCLQRLKEEFAATHNATAWEIILCMTSSLTSQPTSLNLSLLRKGGLAEFLQSFLQTLQLLYKDK